MRLDLSAVDQIFSNLPKLLPEFIVRLARWELIVVFLIIGTQSVYVTHACLMDKEYSPRPGQYILS